MNDPSIIIAGGGIAGLAASLAGWDRDVLVLERAAAFEALGAGLQLGPNAVAALRALGVWEAVEPITARPPEIHLRDGLTGAMLKRIALGQDFERRYGAPYRTAHRADLHQALLSVVRGRRGITLAVNRGVEGLAIDATGVDVRVGAQTTKAAAVIVADGVHSRLRQQMLPDATVIDTGFVFYRALTAMAAPSSVAVDCINVWMFPGGHVVHYPVGRPARLNIVAILGGKAGLHDDVKTWAQPLQEIAQVLTADHPWPGLMIAPLQQWNFGRALLLGDAAHGTLPFLAQGAAMALEDAAVLKRELARSTGFDAAFAGVSDARRERTMRLHRATLAVGRNYHLGGVMRQARNLALPIIPPQLFWKNLDWLYGWTPD